MRHHVLLRVLLVVALATFLVLPVLAEKDKAADKNSHEGTFVGVKAGTTNEFLMKDKDGKNHEHKLAADAKVLGPDGKECKLTELKAGQKIRVTTKEGNTEMAMKVEAMKEDKKEDKK